MHDQCLYLFILVDCLSLQKSWSPWPSLFGAGLFCLAFIWRRSSRSKLGSAWHSSYMKALLGFHPVPIYVLNHRLLSVLKPCNNNQDGFSLQLLGKERDQTDKSLIQLKRAAPLLHYHHNLYYHLSIIMKSAGVDIKYWGIYCIRSPRGFKRLETFSWIKREVFMPWVTLYGKQRLVLSEMPIKGRWFLSLRINLVDVDYCFNSEVCY